MNEPHITEEQRMAVIARALHIYATLHLGQTAEDKKLASQLEMEFRKKNMIPKSKF